MQIRDARVKGGGVVMVPLDRQNAGTPNLPGNLQDGLVVEIAASDQHVAPAPGHGVCNPVVVGYDENRHPFVHLPPRYTISGSGLECGGLTPLSPVGAGGAMGTNESVTESVLVLKLSTVLRKPDAAVRANQAAEHHG
jgi:hypothetical protein